MTVVMIVFLNRRCALTNAQSLERGQREGRRLAGARLGAAHQVVPGEQRADGLLLDGRGRLVTLGANGAEERIDEAQIFKRSFRTQRTLSFIANELRCLSAPRAEDNSRLRSMREARPPKHSAGTVRSKKISRGRELRYRGKRFLKKGPDGRCNRI